MSENKTGASTIGLIAILGVGLDAVRADTVVDSAGFESPTFSAGALEGQDGWLRTLGPGTGSATIQSTVVGSGAQAVRVDRAPGSDDRWGKPVSSRPVNDVITVTWNMRVDQTTGGAGTFGPFFGIEAYDDNGTLGLLGSLGVDATTGDVLYQAQDTGFLTESGATVAFGTWHVYSVHFDFSSHVYQFYLDNVPVGSTGFVDQNNIPGGLDDFSDADIAAFGAAGDAGSQALTGTAYFDNFVVADVPEPAMLAWILPAIAWTRVRRRR